MHAGTDFSDLADLPDIRNLRDFQREIEKFNRELRDAISLECAAFAVDKKASRARAARVQGDYQSFATTYFPHYAPTPHLSRFHEFLFARMPAVIDGAEDGREVHEAPRGEAKSTYATQLGALWCIVTGRKKMIGIFMNTEEQAIEMLSSIQAELDSNPRLQMDFPAACGQGRVWQATTAITRNGAKIRVGGTGKKIRGMKNGPHRPDLIFLDDLENDENVAKKEQRDKVENFVLAAVVGLGPPGGGMDIFWVGTSLHYDAAINRVSRKPGWQRRVFRSILTWPDRMDLWDEWEALYSRTSDDDDEKARLTEEAHAFHRKHAREMAAGARLSWPKVRDLYSLMRLRATSHEAFEKEQQNNPGNDENAPFRNIQYWTQRNRKWRFFGAIDPSLGKRGKGGDPSAILVGGLDADTMILDVLEADITRRTPEMIMERAIALQKEYHCIMWGVEAVQFQYFLYTQMVQLAAKRGVAFPAVPVTPDTDKTLRIQSLQPHAHNGLIRLGHNQSTLISQLKFWPETDHDDGPDALEILWNLATTHSAAYEYHAAARGERYRQANDGGDDDGWGDDGWEDDGESW
uniref:Phage uncharacterized protein (Putative large terminase), C-terminal domain-containing protein n=1 Tax=Candidatus Kentrum sp. UNK TaxID=2126344 RepID=A0A451B2S1_9GAMM|nr:MAG: phage uncharacterized protein (putative large terminase), C-terminal domain-containing protein [Candidatus Kentron sp. UNK]VFK72598.1 MAG: phage uncharacterized protein (putative large terminase), C-terminal domain-containing protein [Candidatus Kentron sp. UNK]